VGLEAGNRHADCSFFVLPILAEVGVVRRRYSVLANFFAEIAQFLDVNSNSLVCAVYLSSLTEAAVRKVF
jgi:hypothetical protein